MGGDYEHREKSAERWPQLWLDLACMTKNLASQQTMQSIKSCRTNYVTWIIAKIHNATHSMCRGVLHRHVLLILLSHRPAHTGLPYLQHFSNPKKLLSLVSQCSPVAYWLDLTELGSNIAAKLYRGSELWLLGVPKKMESPVFLVHNLPCMLTAVCQASTPFTHPVLLALDVKNSSVIDVENGK